MPPKAAPKAAGPSKKTEAKKKEKVIEDKTFGLKNKKGGKQQKFIQQVQKQVHFGGNPSSRKLDQAKEAEKLAKKTGDPNDEILGQIFKPVQKVEKGADPKSILCAFFKQGQCQKGDKCKFSHDLMVERKAERSEPLSPGTSDAAGGRCRKGSPWELGRSRQLTRSSFRPNETT
ncbi:Zinc finger CCCH domain-containing protein 15 [Orchesella cincta]|uniref:Zinc finger CCCH domain-containing protein 15 n=1 Tax=Orchesella cincta TaxID=48709 RepID=A0A1D2MQ95_ORCCI|nr:Zinc finger CCCH domain-containing protein 15 [Orchesella cincta]